MFLMGLVWGQVGKGGVSLFVTLAHCCDSCSAGDHQDQQQQQHVAAIVIWRPDCVWDGRPDTSGLVMSILSCDNILALP